ncbi:MAG: hypothetical protein ABR915_07205 [Thermoguttaceae bacterium]
MGFIEAMMPDAVLIQVPSIDFRTFIGLSHKVLGRSPAAPSDGCRRELSEAERFLSCLAAMRDERAPVGLSSHLLRHVSFSAFIGADERDMLEILQLCSGMPFVVAETIVRGVQAAVVTGTLAQWRDAVASGCSKSVESSVRRCFNKLHGLFTGAGLNVWGDYTPRSGPDQTFLLLEDKRGR